MIESLDEVVSGNQINLYGDVDIQMSMNAKNEAVLCLIQGTDRVVLDAYQLAHMARVFQGIINAGGNLADHVATPGAGG